MVWTLIAVVTQRWFEWHYLSYVTLFDCLSSVAQRPLARTMVVLMSAAASQTAFPHKSIPPSRDNSMKTGQNVDRISVPSQGQLSVQWKPKFPKAKKIMDDNKGRVPKKKRKKSGLLPTPPRKIFVNLIWNAGLKKSRNIKFKELNFMTNRRPKSLTPWKNPWMIPFSNPMTDDDGPHDWLHDQHD